MFYPLKEFINNMMNTTRGQAFTSVGVMSDDVTDRGDIKCRIQEVNPGYADQLVILGADPTIEARSELGRLEEVIGVLSVQLHDRAGIFMIE